MYTVYIIQSIVTKKYYIGQTSNLDSRLIRHNSNQTPSLKNQGPFEVIYTEHYSTRSEAMIREKQIKSYKSGNSFKKLIK